MFDLHWVPPRLPFPARAAVFGLLVVFVGVGAAQGLPARGATAAVGIAVVLGAGATSVFAPPVWCLPGAVVAGAGLVLLGTGQAFNVGWFGLCVFAAWVMIATPLWMALLFWLGAELVICAEAVFTYYDPGWPAWAAGTFFSALGCLLAQNQRKLLGRLQAAQGELAARAQTEERNRIARELHDVIAHSLTVSLLHITSARLTVRDDPASAEAGLAEAERLSRSSLDEVRHTVGLLRTDADPTQPLPGSTDLPELLARFRRAGGSVTDRIAALDGVPAVICLAAHRIVQEALTNALRHAPAEPVRVAVVRTTDELSIEVDSAGAPGSVDGRGHGLLGMRERAAAVGGSCTAGPGGTGWSVRARLPLTTGRAADTPAAETPAAATPAEGVAR